MKRIISFLLSVGMMISVIPIFELKANATEKSWLWPVSESTTLARGFYHYGDRDYYYSNPPLISQANGDDEHYAIDIRPKNLSDGGKNTNDPIMASKSGVVVTVFSGCTCWDGGFNTTHHNNCMPVFNEYNPFTGKKNSGTISKTYGCNNGYGNGVILYHNDGTYSSYAHLNYATVSPGDTVTQGQCIGYMGSSGLSQKKHLDFFIASCSTYSNYIAPKYHINNNPVGLKSKTYVSQGSWNGIEGINYITKSSSVGSGSQSSDTYASVTTATYYFKNLGTGKYLTVDGGKDENCANVSVTSYSGNSNQIMYIYPDGVGYGIQPKSSSSSKRRLNPWCENMYADGDGANVNLFTKSSDGTQLFRFKEISKYQYVVCSAINPDVVLSVNGTNVQIEKYKKGSKCQIWNLCCSVNCTYKDYICTKCGNWTLGSGSEKSCKATTYKVKTAGKAIHSGPYGACAQINTTKKDCSLTVVAEVKNGFGNTWYKLSDGSYVYGDYVKKASNSIFKNTGGLFSVKSLTKKQGEAKSLSSTVSGAKSYSVTINSVKYASANYVNPSQDNEIVFDYTKLDNVLAPGNYNIVFDIETVDGDHEYISQTYTLLSGAVQPSVSSITDISGGKNVKLSSATSGAVIYYTTDGSEPTINSTKYSSTGIDVYTTSTIKAIAVANGVQSASFSTVISVSTLSTPVIATEETPAGTRIIISSKDGATVYWANGGEYSKYTSSIILQTSGMVTAYVERAGYISSGTACEYVSVTPPDTPDVSLPANGSKIAEGTAVTIQWNEQKKASSYTIKIYKDDVLVKTISDVKSTSASFILEQTGTYSYTVQAHSPIGDSDVSEKRTVESMPPSTVSFVDWNDNVIETQEVPYNANATKPSAPSRRGYLFLNWDKSLQNIKSDTIIKAEYQIITYTVKFYDNNGGYLKTIRQTYGGAITPPSDEITLPNGYAVIGWNIDATESDSAYNFDFIDSNMYCTAVVDWENYEFSTALTITKATRNTDSTNVYNVNISMNSIPTGHTTAMLRVSLKTSEGKLVQSSLQTISLPAGSIDTTTSVTLYSSKIAKTVEAVVLGFDGEYKTGSTSSVVAKADVEVLSSYDWGNWSSWSTNPVFANNNTQVETKTQYSYRKKNYTSSNSSSLSGWTKYNTVRTSWGAKQGPVYYDPSNGSRNVWSESYVSSSNYEDVWAYSRSVSGSGLYASNSYAWGYYQYNQVLRLNYRLSSYRDAYGNTSIDGHQIYGPSTYTNENGVVFSSPLWWNEVYEGQRWVSDNYGTRWYYQDPVYTYYYWQWSGWSSWSDNYVAASSDQEVQTRILYRYRNKDVPVYDNLSGEEDVSGKIYSFNGVLESSIDLQGKYATVMAYKGKNTDPNESQLQYISQIQIGENNSYDFSFKTKEAPTIESGDYIVCISIAGSSGLVNVGKIEAPKSKYIVTFYDYDGKVIDEQSVIEGNNAVSPTPPEHEGMRFVSWNNSGTSIMYDTQITAVYTPITYAVVFVDWLRNTADVFALDYGTDLSEIRKDPEITSGFTFIGWDAFIEGNTTVTGNMIISAVYEADTFEVIFATKTNSGDTIVSTQNVEYGKSATPPEDPIVEGMEFLGWDTSSNWWNVTEDTTVYAILSYGESTSNPISNIENDIIIGSEASIEFSSDADAVIYYTTNGSDPIPGVANEYLGPITVTESTCIRALACAPGKDNSDIIDVQFVYSEYNEPEQKEIITDLGYFEINSYDGGQTLYFSTNNDSPIDRIKFFVECNPAVFYYDFNEDLTPVVDVSDEFSNGHCSIIEEPGQGFYITWQSDSDVSFSGRIFSFMLKFGDEIETDIYPIHVYYVCEDTRSDSAQSFACSIYDEYSVWYDANDGEKAPTMQKEKYGNSLSISSEEPTRSGYVFSGWNTEKSGNGVTYYSEDIYSGNESIILYAQWTCKHENYSSTIEKKATCSTNGIITYTCTTCGETRTETILREAHSYKEETSSPATCTEDSKTTFICTVCGDKLTDEQVGSAIGHSFTIYVSDNNATCVSDGTKTAKCDRCDATDTIEEEGSAKGHSYVSKVDAKYLKTAATCTAKANYFISCSLCGEKTSSTFASGKALGHSFSNYVSDENATCTQDGTMTAKCDRCDVTNTILEENSALGHRYISKIDPNYLKQEASCTAKASYYKSCSVCGAKSAFTFSTGITLEHSFTNYVSNGDATCIADGTKTAKCDNCNATDTIADEGSKFAHNYRKTVTAPTCTTNGYTTNVCGLCLATYISDNTPALGHNYDSGKITKSATCTATGVKTYTCTVCKSTKTESIAKVTHTYKTVTTAATLTKDGKIQSKCSVCGNVKSTTAIAKIKTVTLSKTSATYTGKAIKPTVTVKDSKGKTVDSMYYTVTYKNNTNVGKATVTVKFNGNYSGSKTLTFTINPRATIVSKVTSTMKGTATVTVKKQATQTTGYEIQYSTSSKFTASTTKTVKITSAKTLSKTLSKLSSGKTYYVRVRTYKTVSKVDYTSAWSKAVTAKIK